MIYNIQHLCFVTSPVKSYFYPNVPFSSSSWSEHVFDGGSERNKTFVLILISQTHTHTHTFIMFIAVAIKMKYFIACAFYFEPGTSSLVLLAMTKVK